MQPAKRKVATTRTLTFEVRAGARPEGSTSVRFRSIVVCLVAFGLVLPASWAAAKETDRGIAIIKVHRAAPDSVDARIRWDKSELRKGGKNELSLSLVAISGDDATPVLTRGVTANAKQPKRQYAMHLSPTQQDLVEAAESLGFAASQKSGLRNGLYRLAWVTHAGRFPNVALRESLVRASRCSPVTSGGSYSGCYYGYTDMSNIDLSKANFTDAEFPYTTLTNTNFTGSNLSYTQLGYAKLTNANLTNANLTGAYLYGANLSGATTTGAIFTNAQYCNTVMPNGTQNNANC